MWLTEFMQDVCWENVQGNGLLGIKFKGNPAWSVSFISICFFWILFMNYIFWSYKSSWFTGWYTQSETFRYCKEALTKKRDEPMHHITSFFKQSTRYWPIAFLWCLLNVKSLASEKVSSLILGTKYVLISTMAPWRCLFLRGTIVVIFVRRGE
jgi:hypothetical protein